MNNYAHLEVDMTETPCTQDQLRSYVRLGIRHSLAWSVGPDRVIPADGTPSTYRWWVIDAGLPWESRAEILQEMVGSGHVEMRADEESALVYVLAGV